MRLTTPVAFSLACAAALGSTVAARPVFAVSPSAAPSAPTASQAPSAQIGPSAPVADPAVDARASAAPYVDESEPPTATQDIGLPMFSVANTWGLGGDFRFGAGVGLGWPIYRLAKHEDNDFGIDHTADAIWGNVFLRFIPSEYLDLDVGGRLIIGGASRVVEGSPRGGLFELAYFDIRVGPRNLKFGPRFEYGLHMYGDFNETAWKITPLLVRAPL